jgi:VWFA-related protein
MRCFLPSKLIPIVCLLCLPVLCQEVRHVRIGVTTLSSRSNKAPAAEARDELVKALNHHKVDKKMNLGLEALPLDAKSDSQALEESKRKKCEFVLYTRVKALEKSSRQERAASSEEQSADIYTALLEYELRRVDDGIPYAMGVVKSDDVNSSADAILDAISRIPNKVSADLRDSGGALASSRAEASDVERPANENWDRFTGANSCGWLPKNIPHASALHGACEYAVTQPAKMPNFVCEQETSRFHGSRQVPTDLITATIRYVDGEESFSDLKRNGKPAPSAMWNSAGMWSSGQFEGNLRAIFNAANRGAFTFSRESKIGTRTAWVFTYQIARQYEPLWELLALDRLVAPPYEGELWVDEKTGDVLRFSSTAKELPAEFAIRKAEVLTDYDNVAFPDGGSFVLPVKSVVTTRYQEQAPTRNVVEFRGCHKFRATSHMVLDISSTPAGAEYSVAVTLAELEAEKEENETIYSIFREEAIEEDAKRLNYEQQQELKSATGEAFWKLAQLEKEREKIESAKAVRPPSSYEMVTDRNGVATFKVNVKLVPVSVVVRDSKGHAVGDLKQENFELLDNRKPQEIVTFSMEKNEGVQGAKETKPAELASPNVANNRGMPNYVAYLFDDLRSTPVDLGKTTAAAERHLNRLGPNERVGIFTISGDVALEFTSDRDKLQAALKKLRSRSSTSSLDCPTMSYYTADLIVNQADQNALQQATEDAAYCMFGSAAGIGFNDRSGLGEEAGKTAEQQKGRQIAMARAFEVASIGRTESDRTLEMLNNVLSRTMAMPGLRSVILLSPGFLVITHPQQRAAMYLMERAVKAGVVFSALDVRGLASMDLAANHHRPAGPAMGPVVDSAELSAGGEVMADLAYSTGGTYFHNNTDLDEGLRRTADAPQYVYLLGFEPQRLDDKFHKLKIAVKGSPKLTVQARVGYYAMKPAPNAPASNKKNASAGGPLVLF